MRDMPLSTRVAITTLYGRLRQAREQADRARRDQGMGSAAALQAQAAETEAHNALIVVRQNVHRAHHGRLQRVGPAMMIRVAIAKGRARAARAA